MSRISAQIVSDQLDAIVAWSMERADAEAQRFISRQPVVKDYVLATVGNTGPDVVGFVIQMALAIDNVYAGAFGRMPGRITRRIMDGAADQAEQGFAELVGVEPALALRRLLFQRDLAEPELLVELMRVLMDVSVEEPDLERALGVVFLTIKAIALAYENRYGLASGGETKGSLAQVLEARLGRPLPKICRSAPCPCGSGMTFKQCCAQSVSTPAGGPPNRAPAPLGDTNAERLFREYRELVTGTRIYSHVVDQRTDGAWLDERRRELERRYRPGQPGGVPEALMSLYLLYDLELPAARKTVGQLMLEREGHRLHEPGPTRLRALCDSYVAFYELVARRPGEGTKKLRELGTDAAWMVGDVEDPAAASGTCGEVWLCRLVGLPSGAITIMTPLIYPRQARDCLERFVRLPVEDGLSRGLSRADALRTAMKRGVPLLAEYLIAADVASAP